ncbi:MAG: hypothetical protein KUG82_09590 [Pseudomonadales bacterium]|nr:hypothetical protein [Pseudomonadales bacterium]
MKREFKIYPFLAIIFISSFASTFLLPVGDIYKGILASPLLLALLGAIYQVFRDQAKFEKDLMLQNKRQVFNIGATSHMANIAFDKHVEFCEKYMTEVHETFVVMFREGESESALKHAGNLLSIRKDHAAWLTKDMNEKLEPFEQALRDIGAAAHFLKKTAGVPHQSANRSKKMDEAFSKFSALMNFEDGKFVEGVCDIEEVKEIVKGFLGINELTKIREYLVSQAIKEIT